MSKITSNLLVKEARGNVGKQFVYKKRGDNTFIALMPKVSKQKDPTEQQAQQRDRFGEAIAYAQGAVADPELKAAYERKLAPGKTAYNAACRDYLKAPVVKRIDATKYNGVAGAAIQVVAKDDFRVAEVVVSIRTATGTLVEEGNAILDPINRNKWTYTTVQANPDVTGSTVSVTARDIPGNEARLEVTV